MPAPTRIKIAEDLVGISKDITLKELKDKFTVVYASGSISSSDNTAGFSITLNKGHRRLVDIYYKLGGAGDLIIEVSVDGSTWRTYHSESFSAATENIYSFETAYPYVRVRTPTTGIDVTFEIVAV